MDADRKNRSTLLKSCLISIVMLWLTGCGGGASESQPSTTNTSGSSTANTQVSSSSNADTSSTALASSSGQYSLVSSQGTVIDPEPLNPDHTSQSTGSTGNVMEANPDAPATDISPNPNVAARVIDEDERFPVYAQAYPYRATALITHNNASFCTGWLASKDTLVTAGHCIHTNGSWLNPHNYKIYPGYADGYAPYGSCEAKEIYAAYAWVTTASSDADVGIIKLDCDIGNTTGWFSYLVTTPTNTDLLTINGYPGDKAGGTEQWASHGNLIFTSPGKLYYNNDTYVGMSGAPVWLANGNETAAAIAVHTNTINTFAGESNAGTRISQEVFDLISAASKLP